MKDTQEKDSASILNEISEAVKNLNQAFGKQENIGYGLETQINLYFTYPSMGRQLNYSINKNWSIGLQSTVKNVILNTSAKYPKTIITSTEI